MRWKYEKTKLDRQISGCKLNQSHNDSDTNNNNNIKHVLYVPGMLYGTIHRLNIRIPRTS